MTTNAQTYDGNITILQQGSTPGPGDKVENITNGDISLTNEEGKKISFQVRDGVIVKQISNTPWDRLIVWILFVLMMILTIYLSALWHF
ncbi:MAG: hypothetical protein ACOC2C_03470 [Cyclonatronaceae bacterium]